MKNLRKNQKSVSHVSEPGQQRMSLLMLMIKKFSFPKIKIWFDSMFFSEFFCGFYRHGGAAFGGLTLFAPTCRGENGSRYLQIGHQERKLRGFARNFLSWCPRQESNLHYKLRKLVFYPLNYEGNSF